MATQIAWIGCTATWMNLMSRWLHATIAGRRNGISLAIHKQVYGIDDLFIALTLVYAIWILVGYVLTEDGNKNCLKRKGITAMMIKCDKGYSGLSLQCKFFFDLHFACE